eukprot:21730-Eustigmatos_ZCMA.PRE.1
MFGVPTFCTTVTDHLTGCTVSLWEPAVPASESLKIGYCSPVFVVKTLSDTETVKPRADGSYYYGLDVVTLHKGMDHKGLCLCRLVCPPLCTSTDLKEAAKDALAHKYPVRGGNDPRHIEINALPVRLVTFKFVGFPNVVVDHLGGTGQPAPLHERQKIIVQVPKTDKDAFLDSLTSGTTILKATVFMLSSNASRASPVP